MQALSEVWHRCHMVNFLERIQRRFRSRSKPQPDCRPSSRSTDVSNCLALGIRGPPTHGYAAAREGAMAECAKRGGEGSETILMVFKWTKNEGFRMVL